MRILIISDTHTDSIKKLPKIILEEAKNSDCVIHAGDIVGLGLIKELERINPIVYAVKGNMDPFYPGRELPAKRILEFDGIRLGIIHGSGSPDGLENRISYEFNDVDIIVYGHSHRPLWAKVDKLWFLNPGSATNNRYDPQNSYAILIIENGKFDAKIYRIKENI